MKKLLAIGVLGISITGCTSIQVKNNEGFQPQSVKQICVINNPKVIIAGFDDSIVRSFARYNINARVYPQASKAALCETTMDYTALRSWDFVTYMSYAKFTLMKEDRIVSEAEFRLKGKGGFALNKWRSTDTKIDELVDVLVGSASK
ncbi:Sbal_3080 family lipoprotein [Acinetobacter sp. ANC 3781]